MLGMIRRLGLACISAFLVVSGSNPARAAEPVPLATFGHLPGFERAAISPTGDRIAVVGTVDGVRRLIVLDQAEKPLLALPLGEAKVRGVYWAGDDRVLVYKSDTSNLGVNFTADKVELFSMIVVPINGEKMWAVFEHNKLITGGVRRFLGIQERAGRFYGYFGGITLDGDFRSAPYLRNTKPVLYEVDLQDQKTTEIAPRSEDQIFRDWVLAANGAVSATLDFDSRSGSWNVKNGTGQRIAEGTNPLGKVDLVGLGATAGTAILSETDAEGGRHWFEIPLAGGERKEILPDAALNDVYFDPVTNQLIGYKIEGDVPAYSFFDPYRQKVAAAIVKAFPEFQAHLQGWNDRFDHLLVMTEGVGDAQTWWMIDIKGRNSREIGHSYPIKAADVGPMRMVKYTAGDGTEIAGVLTLPPARKAAKLPVVILPHGGPGARDYPGFDWWAQALASRGYAVLQPNFRGSTGYSAAFRRAGYGQWGRKMQSDVSDGLAWLVAQGIADPKRACIMGASYGGYAALAGVTLQQGLYRCAVAVAGVSDVAKLASTDIQESGNNDTLKRALKEELGERKDLRPISPINFAAKADAPILLIHGKDDTVVAYAQSTAMAAALRTSGKPVELVTLPGEDHWLSRGETRLAMLEAAVRFIVVNNPPDPAP
ncbi:S9 family peptidase [Novosphingobium sp. Chol11]|uniref:alpha/beta hydrolase family protein n=1 Tax=Novosphingobium sp. Chol11 TaxID=1385763 RepID=UPI0025F0EDCB|nr:S9 family peptidase [Novosphingobium sp. Chol11]